MKLHYGLSLLLIVIIVVVCVSSCASSTATPPSSVFFNAQKLRGGQRPPQQIRGRSKQPVLSGKAPAPSKKDIGPKCTAGDAYCVYAGVPQGACMASWCLPPPRNGDPCKYTDEKNKYSENCVKATPPVVQEGGGEATSCVDTSAERCDPSQQCVHYTCKTPEDAKRLKVKLDKNEMNFTCGKTDTDVFNCKTVGNTTFCGCGWMRPEDNGGKCPDGMVVKKWSGSARCSPRLEHSTLLNSKRGPCTYEKAVQYSFCAMPPPPAES